MDLNYDQFNGDALIFKYNLDEYGNPISIKVDKEEKQVSVHGTIQLEYVPDEYNRVVILNEDNTQMTEVFNRDEIKPNTYYVDYNNGVVYLDKSQFGKTKIYNYYKKGLQLIGCSRIYDEHDVSGKHVVLTLQEIIDAGREALRFLLDIGDAKKVIELLESLIAEGKLTITNLENKKNECIQSINNAISQATQDKNEIVQEIQDNIQQAKDEVVNVAGNKEVIIRSSDWALNIDVYEKEISHNLNSENLHVTAKNSDTKEAVTIGYKILDKTRILLKSDEAINMSVILSASYYHATQAISDDIAEEVVKARKGEASLDVKITKIDEQLDNITPYKTEFINVILIGCDNTGVNDCTSILQEYIDNGYSLFFPEGKYKCNLIMKPQITLCGEGLGLVTLIPNNKNVDVIKADLSVYNYTIKDLTIDGLNTMGTQSYTGHGIYLSNEGSLAQQDLEPHLENIKIVNVIDGLKVDEGVRGGLFKNIKAGACVIGINHLSTDCIFTDCVTAQTQKHGIFILKSNNTLVSCKAFIAGLGKVEGAGIKVQGSYNRVINCESQQNVFECLHLQNANSNIIQGCILDGSGYNSKTWFPDLTYTETGGAVPISILRIYNSNSNIIDCTIINGRIDSYAKCGLYNQYVGSDSNNDIRLSIIDTDTATTKPFTNYQLDDTNKYFKNNRVIINSTMMQNKSWLVPSVMNNDVEILGGGYIVKDGICYINLKFKGLNTYTWDNEVLQGLPVPLMDSISIASNLLDREIVIEGNKMIVRKGITTNSTYKVTACYIIK